MHADRNWPFLSDPHYPFLSAVWAVVAHGTIGVIVVLPVVWRTNRRVLYGALAFIGAVAVDLDHPIAAGSLSPRAMEHLMRRPDTHSLVVAVAIAIVVLGVTRQRLVAWGVFAVFVSHLLFDAAGGSEQWLFPLEQPDSIPWIVCPAGIVVLTGISWALARAEQPPPPTTGHSPLTT